MVSQPPDHTPHGIPNTSLTCRELDWLELPRELPPPCAPDACRAVAFEGSNATVAGGEYTCESFGQGGFLFVEGGTRVRIRAGLFQDNFSGMNGGAVHCGRAGEEADILIEGGTFRNNKAQASGGAISLSGTDVVVTMTGGTFIHNTAA